MKNYAILKEASVLGCPGNYYAVGRVYEDYNKRFADGLYIVTSDILFVYFIDGKYYLTTRNSLYEAPNLQLPQELAKLFVASGELCLREEEL